MRAPALQNPVALAKCTAIGLRTIHRLANGKAAPVLKLNPLTYFKFRILRRPLEKLIQMVKKFQEAASRGEQVGLTDDEMRFYDALANNEPAFKELADEALKKVANELTPLAQRSLLDCDRTEAANSFVSLAYRSLANTRAALASILTPVCFSPLR